MLEERFRNASQPAPALPSPTEVNALGLALLRSVFTRPDLSEAGRQQFIDAMLSGKEELTLGFGDFQEMARMLLVQDVVDVKAEHAAWQSWYYDPEGVGGRTFGYQDTREGHHEAFASKSEQAWLQRARIRPTIGLTGLSEAKVEPGLRENLKQQVVSPAPTAV